MVAIMRIRGIFDSALLVDDRIATPILVLNSVEVGLLQQCMVLAISWKSCCSDCTGAKVARLDPR